MAILKYNNFALEYTILKVIEPLYTVAKMRFLHQGESIINPKLCKYQECFSIYDDSEDNLIWHIEETLKTDMPCCSQDSDMISTIAIYPEEFFPFFTNIEKKQRVDDGRTWHKNSSKIKKSSYFTLIAFVSFYHMDKIEYTSTDGISMHLCIEREELEHFLSELKVEYANATKYNEG